MQTSMNHSLLNTTTSFNINFDILFRVQFSWALFLQNTFQMLQYRLRKVGHIMSGTDNLQDHMNKGMYGTPQLKPDEKRKYLGTFRERVSLTITFQQLKDPQALVDLKEELAKNPDLYVIINGQLEQQLLASLLKIVKEADVPFTLNTDQALATCSDALAVVVCAKKTALHEATVDVFQKYPEKKELTPEKSQKEEHFSFFHDLFK